jgi:hypothetical protein
MIESKEGRAWKIKGGWMEKKAGREEGRREGRNLHFLRR